MVLVKVFFFFDRDKRIFVVVVIVVDDDFVNWFRELSEIKKDKAPAI